MRRIIVCLGVGLIFIGCKSKPIIDIRNINSYIQQYYDLNADTLDYTRFNRQSGYNRIICINPRLDALEFFLIDSNENHISYYKDRIEREYLLKSKTSPMPDKVEQ
jgi:hypothetical protein